MKFKLLSVIIVLIFFTSFVSAQNYGIWLHTINVNIASNGNAEISEKFHLFFPTDNDKIEFRETSKSLGSDLKKWETFDNKFVPTIGLNNIINGTISYSEGEDNFLEIKYNLADALMAKGKDTALVEEYSIKANYLNKLYQAGLWVIPDSTTITIEFPPGAEIKDGILPEAIIGVNGTRKTITWVGYKSANQLNVKYVLWKKINPIINLNEVSDYLFRTNEGLMIIFVTLIIVGGIVWKRNYFASKIEKFVENNTRFEED